MHYQYMILSTYRYVVGVPPHASYAGYANIAFVIFTRITLFLYVTFLQLKTHGYTDHLKLDQIAHL